MLNRQNIRQVSFFLLVGMLNTGVDFGVYYFLTRATGLYFVAANVISVFCATTFGFFLHKSLTFQNQEKKYGHQYLKFWGVSLGTLWLNSGIVFVLVHFAGLHDLISKLAATIVTMVWSFFMQRFWVFRNKLNVI